MPYTKLEIIEIAERYSEKAKFREEQPSAYKYACRQGWLKSVTSHMAAKRYGPEPKNTKSAAKKAAKQYLTRSEFRERDHSLYVTAAKHGWLDEICVHMESGYKLRYQDNKQSSK